MYDLRVIVHEIKGFCDMPMKVGDYFEVKGGKIIIPEDRYICMWALQSMMPFLPAKQRKIDEENDWIPYTEKICCPDPNGMVIYRIETINPRTKEMVVKEKNNEKTSLPRMLVNEDVCTGCRACETVCSFTYEGSFNGLNSRIKVEKDEEEGSDIPYVCRQCGNASCIEVCTEKALYKDEKTKAVFVDKDKCIGCKLCAEACPFDSISFDLDIKPLICDLCLGDPECIKRCPVNAITLSL